MSVVFVCSLASSTHSHQFSHPHYIHKETNVSYNMNSYMGFFASFLLWYRCLRPFFNVLSTNTSMCRLLASCFFNFLSFCLFFLAFYGGISCVWAVNETVWIRLLILSLIHYMYVCSTTCFLFLWRPKPHCYFVPLKFNKIIILYTE